MLDVTIPPAVDPTSRGLPAALVCNSQNLLAVEATGSLRWQLSLRGNGSCLEAVPPIAVDLPGSEADTDFHGVGFRGLGFDRLPRGIVD